MTVTRYKRQKPAADAIRDAVMGVMRHTPGIDRREPTVAKVAEPAKPAASRIGGRTIEDLTTHHAAVVEPRAPMRIGDGAKARARRKTRHGGGESQQTASQNPYAPFQAYKPPPGVLPKGAEPALALDSAIASWADSSATNAWNFANPIGESFSEGIGFLGYAYLSQLTQRPEYRRISERLATEMTRKWIRLTIAGEADPEEADASDEDADEHDEGLGSDARPDAALEDEEDNDADGAAAGGAVADDQEEEDDEPTPEDIAQRKRNEKLQKKLKKIEADMKRLDLRGKFKTVAEFDGWMGRSHLYIDTGDKDDPEELKTNLGNGSDETSKTKFKKGSLRGIKHIEPIWCYPVNYNANDPLDDAWYNPELWFAMAKQIHVSRLLTFVGRPVPDILKPSYAFGGLSMSQMAKPYVDNWLRTRQAVTNLIESFSVSGVYTNAQSLLQGGGEEVLDRIELFNVTRTNAGSMVLDKETEEFFNISTPLGTLDHLQAQSQEQMSSVSGIPLIVLLGITPSGLNASSEGELRVFYDLINAMQENLFRDKLHRILCFIQLNLFGEIDPAIGFEFEPLWSLDEKGEADVKKIEAETHTIYVDSGVISPEEIRKIVVADEDSPYNGLDPDETPDPPAEEGLLPGGGGMGGGGASSSGHDNKEVEGAADALPPDWSLTEVTDDVWAFDEGQFDESKVKRDQDGKFSTTGAGGGAAAGKSSAAKALAEVAAAVGGKFNSKKEIIGHLLTKGTTAKEIMETMGWPSVSMPAQAKSLGMKLEKYSEGGKLMYKGTPMTAAEQAEAKAAAPKKGVIAAIAEQVLKDNPDLAAIVAKPVSPKSEPSSSGYMAPKDYAEFVNQIDAFNTKGDEKSVQDLMKYNPAYADKLLADYKTVAAGKPVEAPKPKLTDEQVKKAGKGTAVSLNLIAGEKPSIVGSPQMKGVEAQIKAFNDKYAGKQLNDTKELAEKVEAYKNLTAYTNTAAKEEQAKKAEIQAEAHKKAVENAKKAATEAAEKEAKEKAKVAEQHKEVREALGIKKEDTAAIEAFDSFIEHFGGAEKAIKQFKSWQSTAEKEAKDNPGKGYDKLSGFEMGCIKGYTGPKSSWINDAIINDSMTPAQFMFEKVLNSALDKLPKVNGKIVRRGLTMDAKTMAKMEPGKVWTHRNFASSNDKGWGGNTKLHIMTSGKGAAYVGDISSHEHENETLFKSNLRLLIDKVEKDSSGVTHVHCREI